MGSLDKGYLPRSADTRQPEMELRALKTPEDGDAEVRRGQKGGRETEQEETEGETKDRQRDRDNTDKRRER